MASFVNNAKKRQGFKRITNKHGYHEIQIISKNRKPNWY